MIPVNIHTLSRYAAHVSLTHTMKNHRSPALSVMMIFSDLCIRSTLDSYSEQGWEISEKRSGLHPSRWDGDRNHAEGLYRSI